MLRALLALAVAHLVADIAMAQESRPRVPPGRDPGGVAVALICAGVDYTQPAIAGRLARDGEGEIIGWDFESNDSRPFDRGRGAAPPGQGGTCTALAGAIADQDQLTRLIVVRPDPRDPASLGRAAAFVAQTPARIAVVAMWSPRREDWEPFSKAAAHFAHILFVLPAGDDGKDLDGDPAYPAALGLPNAIVVAAATGGAGAQLLPTSNWGGKTVDAVAAGTDSVGAAGVAAKAAASLLSREPELRGPELKRRLLQGPVQRQGETPQKTRSLAVLSPVTGRPERQPIDPAARVLDKKRIPEVLEKRPRGEPRDITPGERSKK